MPCTLVIDDDVALVETLDDSAAIAGLDVATATSWDEGLAVFLTLGPSLVVADYNMPGTDNGLKLLTRIKALRPSVRLVLFSGYLDEADMARLVADGLVDRVLTKGSAVDTADALLAEARQAPEMVDRPADWVQYARSCSGPTAFRQRKSRLRTPT